jgi:hypothetical protein
MYLAHQWRAALLEDDLAALRLALRKALVDPVLI